MGNQSAFQETEVRVFQVWSTLFFVIINLDLDIHISHSSEEYLTQTPKVLLSFSMTVNSYHTLLNVCINFIEEFSVRPENTVNNSKSVTHRPQ